MRGEDIGRNIYLTVCVKTLPRNIIRPTGLDLLTGRTDPALLRALFQYAIFRPDFRGCVGISLGASEL